MAIRRTAAGFRGVIAALIAMTSPAALAGTDGSDTPNYSLGGFGTVGAVHSSEHQADFTGENQLRPSGAGFTHAWSADIDSRLGAQATVNIMPRLSLVLQVIAEQNYDNSYLPHVEWALIKYQFTPEFSVRLGRSVLPSFLVSDARKVGYANPWVRPPVDVYGLIPVTNSDGADASYRLQWGRFVHTLSGSLGATHPNLPNRQGKADANRLWTVADTIEYGPATFRASYLESRVTVAFLNQFFDAFEQFGPQGQALHDRYDQESKRFRFVGLAAMYDAGQWFAMGEWGRANFHSVFGEHTAWYVTGGYRWKKLTPYATYAQSRADNLSDPGLTVSALPPFLAGPATQLNAALNASLQSKVVQDSVSGGLRWDFMKNVDLKVQYGRMRIGAGSTGALLNAQPGFRLGNTVNLVSASVDFVF